MVTEKTLQKIIRNTVHETLAHLGFSVEAPQEVQSDLLYLRKMRKGAEFVALRAKASMVAVLASGFLYLLWDALKDALKR